MSRGKKLLIVCSLIFQQSGGFTPVCAFAEPPPGGMVPQVSSGAAETKPSPEPAHPPAVESADSLLYRAVNLITAKSFGPASDILAAARDEAGRDGYHNLPFISFELLRRAQLMSAEKHFEEAGFLVRRAVELSADEPRVYFAASSFTDALGQSQAWSYFWNAILLSRSYPFMIVSGAVTALLLMLAAGTLALLVALVVQTLRNCEAIFDDLSRSIPHHYRSFGAIGLMVIFLVIPLFFGIVPSLVCWSILLSRSVPSCRRVVPLVSALVVAWGLAIPVAGNVGRALLSPGREMLQEVSALSRVPHARETLESARRERPNDRLIAFLLGNVAYLEGRFLDASGLYQAVATTETGNDKLAAAAAVNRGAALLRASDARTAKDVLEKLEQSGEASYALFHNLSLANLALLDTSASRDYATKANDQLPNRLRVAMVLQGAEQTHEEPALVGAPFVALASSLFWPVTASPGEDVVGDLLATKLMRGTTPLVLVVFGIISFIGGAMLGTSRNPMRETAVRGERLSPVWHLIPAGGLLAGERPILGTAVLSALVACIMLAAQTPVQPLPLVPMHVPMVGLSAVAAVMVLAGGVLLSRLVARSERSL